MYLLIMLCVFINVNVLKNLKNIFYGFHAAPSDPKSFMMFVIFHWIVWESKCSRINYLSKCILCKVHYLLHYIHKFNFLNISIIFKFKKEKENFVIRSTCLPTLGKYVSVHEMVEHISARLVHQIVQMLWILLFKYHINSFSVEFLLSVCYFRVLGSLTSDQACSKTNIKYSLFLWFIVN